MATIPGIPAQDRVKPPPKQKAFFEVHNPLSRYEIYQQILTCCKFPFNNIFYAYKGVSLSFS